ncbi:MAG: hypothetical protein MSH34_03170 [Oscillospiraceae bacterium]|nr:hypothetical protein [Oscillospiraceae bacterium]MDD7292410.1 hypothetical protein [Clostridiaceae bacterium]MDY5990673.1 hypothetical protein [Oscillospiraceae bacterium]
MKRALFAISTVSIACSLFLIVYMIDPGIINYDDGWGFFGMLTNIILPGVAFPLWLIFVCRKTGKDKALQIVLPVSIAIYLTLIGVMFISASELGFYSFIMIAILSIVVNCVCIIKTYKKV